MSCDSLPPQPLFQPPTYEKKTHSHWYDETALGKPEEELGHAKHVSLHQTPKIDKGVLPNTTQTNHHMAWFWGPLPAVCFWLPLMSALGRRVPHRGRRVSVLSDCICSELTAQHTFPASSQASQHRRTQRPKFDVDDAGFFEIVT
ncbi:hypothetical protein TcasGA2_TC013934 [Tribolium castaneum]|uniref:Uncharacterized protein n=1 Tax=Tribolium castaneum TaxID=7070 RepID=D6WNL6_TRICA|nr:hypothetical protein TcasGA2_TC013934 [Tribolium castaneum]